MDSPKSRSSKATGFDSSKAGMSSNCPLCDAVFDPSQALIVDESSKGVLFHLTCGKCRSSLLAVVAVSKIGINSFGMLTDLSAADVRRLRKARAVSQDDVLRAYLEFINLSGPINKKGISKTINSISKK